MLEALKELKRIFRKNKLLTAEKILLDEYNRLVEELGENYTKTKHKNCIELKNMVESLFDYIYKI